MRIFKYIGYFIYMMFVWLKGIKFKYIYKTKGEREAFMYGQNVFYKWCVYTIKTVGMDIEIKGYEYTKGSMCFYW